MAGSRSGFRNGIRGPAICIIPPYEGRVAAAKGAGRPIVRFVFSTARNKVGPCSVKYGSPVAVREGSAFTTFRASTRFSPSPLRSTFPSSSPFPSLPSDYRVTNFARCKPRISPIGAPCQFSRLFCLQILSRKHRFETSFEINSLRCTRSFDILFI